MLANPINPTNSMLFFRHLMLQVSFSPRQLHIYSCCFLSVLNKLKLHHIHHVSVVKTDVMVGISLLTESYVLFSWLIIDRSTL